VRAVRLWAGGAPAGEAPRAAAWQERLEALAEPVGTGSEVAPPAP
jgi:hypothetical protein